MRKPQEKSDWEAHKELEKVEVESKDKMNKLRERVVTAINQGSAPITTKPLISRKRNMSGQAQNVQYVRSSSKCCEQGF